jgi:hypothetical protein
LSIRSFISSSILLIFVVYALPVYAQTAERLDVEVKDVKGDVEIMPSNTLQWIPARAGITFPEGTQIRTGPFSSASLVFADSSVALVDSFTFMTVEKFSKSGNVVTTRINLIVGSSVNTLNDGTTFENDYKIITPSFTASLMGNEIKKVVAGAMYRDTVRTGYRKGGDANDERTGHRKAEKAGSIARERQRQRESSIAP